MFPDHYLYQVSDFNLGPSSIIMTEKRLIKCQRFADERFGIYSGNEIQKRLHELMEQLSH